MTALIKPLRAMVSYSHRDEAFRQDLDRVLASLKRQNLLEVWSDHEILAGSEIDKSIDEALKSVEIILLLISPDFVASDYCYSVELRAALARHESNDAVVVPIIIRPTDWEGLPFSKLKFLPEDAKPVSVWPDRDSAWLNVAKSLRELIADQARRISQDNGHAILPVRAHLKAEFTRLHKRYECGPDIPNGVFRSGIEDLDDLLDGFHKADVVLIGSRQGHGNHDLLLQIAVHNVCSQRHSVLYISPRDAGPRIMRRAISCLGRVRWHYLSTGGLSEEEWPRITASITLLSEARLLVDDSANPSAIEMLTRLAAACSSSTPDAIFIEGLDYFSSRAESGVLDEKDISKRIRRIARDYNIPVVVSVALNGTDAASYTRMSDLGPWQCFEQEADKILLVHNEGCQFDGVCSEQADLIVAKNSHGVSGLLRLKYSIAYHRFEGSGLDLVSNEMT